MKLKCINGTKTVPEGLIISDYSLLKRVRGYVFGTYLKTNNFSEAHLVVFTYKGMPKSLLASRFEEIIQTDIEFNLTLNSEEVFFLKEMILHGNREDFDDLTEESAQHLLNKLCTLSKDKIMSIDKVSKPLTIDDNLIERLKSYISECCKNSSEMDDGNYLYEQLILLQKSNRSSIDLQWLKSKSVEYFNERNIPWKDTRVTCEFISELIRRNSVKIKDNPVPSIDSFTMEEILYIESKLDNNGEDIYDTIQDKIDKIKQNGVETDKEQPKEHNCKHVRREGESCRLNNNCTYPDCPTEENLCHCGGLLSNDGSSCGSMWCPNDAAN